MKKHIIATSFFLFKITCGAIQNDSLLRKNDKEANLVIDESFEELSPSPEVNTILFEETTLTRSLSVVALESLQYPGSYLDAGGDRKVMTAAKPYNYNGFRKWKVNWIDRENNIFALESLQFPGSYLEPGGDRKVWTAAKSYDYNNFRKWKVHWIDPKKDIIALESLEFPESYLDAGGDRKVMTTAKSYGHDNFRKWKMVKIEVILEEYGYDQCIAH